MPLGALLRMEMPTTEWAHPAVLGKMCDPLPLQDTLPLQDPSFV